MNKKDSQVEHNQTDMKRKIMDQIDKTIKDSPIKVRKDYQQTIQNTKNAAMSTTMNENTIERSSSDINVQNQMTSGGKRYSITSNDQDEGSVVKNLITLKNQIIEKEQLQDESSYRLKNKSNQLNDELDLMRQRLIVMQESVHGRDKIIAEYQLQMDNMRNSHFFNNNSRKQSGENPFEKAQEEMHNNIIQLKNKLSLRKAQICELKDEMKKMEYDYQEERRRILEERSTLERTFEEYREKYDHERLKSVETERLLDKARFELTNRDAMTERLQQNSTNLDKNLSELQIRLSQEQDLSKELRIQNQMQEKKIVEYEKQLNHFDEKLQRQKRKLEEERMQVLGEKKKEYDRRKQKSVCLKQELKVLERRVDELTTEGLDIRTEHDRLQRQIQSLKDELSLKNSEISSQKETIITQREDIDTLKHSYRDSDLLIKREQQEYKKLEKEIKQANEQVIERDEIINEFKYQLKLEKEQYSQLEQEIQHLTETNRQQLDLITKIERQNEFLSNIQNRDIDKLEERVEHVNNEVCMLRKENDNLRQENLTLRNDISVADRDSNAYKERLYKYKQQIKILKQALADADNKLRELISQKNNEIRQIQSPLIDDEYY